MNKNEESKFSMYRAVLSVLKENVTVFSGTPALVKAVDAFGKVFESITGIDEKYLSVSKGKALEKQNAQEELIETLLKVGGVLFIDAKAKKDENLKILSTLSYSGLKRMRDNDFLTKAKNVLKNAQSATASLKTLHTDIETDIKELEKQVKAYENAANVKETKTAESHAGRTALDEAFDNADEILKDEIDNLIELIRTKNPDLYNKYLSARVVKYTGARKTKTIDETAN